MTHSPPIGKYILVGRYNNLTLSTLLVTKMSLLVITILFNVGQNSFQHLDFDGSLWPLYHLMLQSWYQNTAELLVNTNCYHFRNKIGYHSNSMTH